MQKEEDLEKTRCQLAMVREKIRRLKKELSGLEDELIHLRIQEERLR